MRTTLTLDDDVVAALERRRTERGTRLRDEVNELLRIGLRAQQQPSEPSEAYELPTFDPGRQLIADSQLIQDLLEDDDVDRAVRHLR